MRLSAPGRRPKTRSCPDVTGTKPRIIWSRVVLPDPLAPMTATMPPAGTSKEGCDQISRPPRTALTSQNRSAVRSAWTSQRDPERLRQLSELGVLPARKCRLVLWNGLRNGYHRDIGSLGGGADLVGY